MTFLLILQLALILTFCSFQSYSSFKLNTFTKNKISRIPTKLHTFVDLPAGEFEKEVIQSPLPVVVDFSATWCGPCKLMLPIFKSLAEEYSSDEIKLVKVDTDVHEDTVDRFNIQGVPLFGIFINGEIVASHSGAITKDKLREFIEKNANVKVKAN